MDNRFSGFGYFIVPNGYDIEIAPGFQRGR